MHQAPDVEDVEQVPESLWRRIRAEPERAPEHIALAAAERFHEPARRWAAITLPYHPPEKAAQIAVKKHVRLSRLEGAVAGLGGAFTAAADMAALIWIQSRMVFYVAASYGYDPAHPMRPAELLVIQEVYATAEEARAALDGLSGPMALHVLDAQLRRNRDQQLVMRLARYAGRRLAQRYAAKAIPFVSSPIAAVQNSRATADVGRRAITYYGG